MGKAVAFKMGAWLYCGKCGSKLAKVAEAAGEKLKCSACGTVNSATVKHGQGVDLPLDTTEKARSSVVATAEGVILPVILLAMLQLFLFAARFGLAGRVSIDVAVLVLGSPLLVALKLVVGGLLLALSWWIFGKLFPVEEVPGRPTSLGLWKAMRIMVVPIACDLVLTLAAEIIEDTPIPVEYLGNAPLVIVAVAVFVSLVIALKRVMPTNLARALGVASVCTVIAVLLVLAVLLSMARFEHW